MREALGGVGDWLVNALDPQPGETILELAAGLADTGFAAASRIGPDGRLIVTDFSAGMIDAARRHGEELGVATADFATVDAERLELEDGSVDGVLCRMGYMLIADPEAALRETHRVLTDRGRVAFAVWGAPERNPWATVVARRVMEQSGGPPPDPEAPGVFAMASEERMRALLSAAGFEPRAIEELEVTWRFGSADDYWRFILDLAGGLAIVIRQMPEDDQHAVEERVTSDLAAYSADGGFALPGVALNVLVAPISAGAG